VRISLLDRVPYAFMQVQSTKLASEEPEVHTRTGCFVGCTTLPRVQLSLLLPLTAYERRERTAVHDYPGSPW
jgi:hypothetical protein